MVLLRDILSIPEFSKFRVVSGFNGINEPVTTAGYLDWESGSDIAKNFPKGEFVITTLATAKGKPEFAESCIKTLIRNKVAAIAIKDVCFSDVSDAVKEYSNEHNVPIIFFSDLFTDDVSFVVKNEIRRGNAENAEHILSFLLSNADIGEENLTQMLTQLDPFLQGNVLFCAYISIAGSNTEISPILAQKFNSFGNNNMNVYAEELSIRKNMHEDVKYTFLPYKRGLFHIFTAKNIDAFDNDFPGKFLETFFEINDDFRIGISSSKGGCTVFRDALRESVYANISCIIYEKVMLNFNATGINRILCPASVTENLKRYYSSLDILINKACSEIGSEELKKTLTEYVICNGDIPAVSKKTHQHPNTIRYRISKVKDVWECENELDFQTEITMYIRTGQILDLLV